LLAYKYVSSSNNKNMSNKKETILIIEDEKLLLDVLSKQLKKENYNVLTAVDGEDGAKKIFKDKPDLVLLDMVLPLLDGYGVLRKIKEKGLDVPVIIISNSGQPVDIDKCFELGVLDYLIKAEFEPEEVVEKVNCYFLIKRSGLCDKPGVKKIMLIEDDKFLRDLCVKKLVQEGFCVDIALEGAEGFRKIEKKKPNLILLDVVMPGMNGFAVLEKIRAHKDKDVARIPIIMLSNLGQDSDIEKARKLGANDYMIKANFGTDEIVKKIRSYLGK